MLPSLNLIKTLYLFSTSGKLQTDGGNLAKSQIYRFVEISVLIINH